MASIEKTDSRGRKALLWGIGIMLGFTFLAVLTGFLSHIGPAEWGFEMRFGEVLSWALGAVAIAGFLLMLFGFFELGSAAHREEHHHPGGPEHTRPHA